MGFVWLLFLLSVSGDLWGSERPLREFHIGAFMTGAFIGGDLVDLARSW